MNNQQNPTQLEEKRLCKKCGQRLPNKSGFCMYCGTDNSTTSVQSEFEIKNNEVLKKYRVIEAQKYSPLWYLIFILLTIDIIVINCIMTFNHDKMFVKVNNARFQNYEESFYLGEGAYLGVKNQKAKVIGINRLDYLDITSEIQNHTIKDIQVASNIISQKSIYILTTEKKLITITGKMIVVDELEEDYTDVYDYLNQKNNNCTREKEYIVLGENSFYYNKDTNEIYTSTGRQYTYDNDKLCVAYNKNLVLSSSKIDLDNPKLIHQDSNGKTIILKDKDEVVKIESGVIKERIKEFNIKGKKVKVENIKEIFYEPDNYYSRENFLIIDKKDGIYNTASVETPIIDDTEISMDTLSLLIKSLNDDIKINLIIILVILICNTIFLYKMSDQHTFSKCLSMSGILMIELVLFILFRGGGFSLDSAKQFFTLLENLFLIYLFIIIISTVITQIAELTIKLLDLIQFRNIFSYAFVYVAILSLFLVISTSGKYGLFFAVFCLGSFWAYFTEREDIDIDLFILPSAQKTIIIFAVINVILFIMLINIFHICDYFIFLLLIAVMFSLYLTARPTLTKKEITGKTLKSLLVMIMYFVYTFISGLFAMNLFTTLQEDFQGIIIRQVIMMGITNILYLIVTFILLIIISTIFRILHKIIKTSNKKTNSVTVFFLFGIITLLAFTAVIYFFPEIVNLIDTAVHEISSNFSKK